MLYPSVILPKECLTAGSQERQAWVSTQTRRTQHMLKMQQIQELLQNIHTACYTQSGSNLTEVAPLT